MVERGSRFERSVVTFGPVGRVVATAVVVAPLWLVHDAGVVGILGAAMWVTVVLPLALRDIWRPALLPSTELTRLRDTMRREAQARRDAQRPQRDEPRPPPPRRW